MFGRHGLAPCPGPGSWHNVADAVANDSIPCLEAQHPDPEQEGGQAAPTDGASVVFQSCPFPGPVPCPPLWSPLPESLSQKGSQQGAGSPCPTSRAGGHRGRSPARLRSLRAWLALVLFWQKLGSQLTPAASSILSQAVCKCFFFSSSFLFLPRSSMQWPLVSLHLLHPPAKRKENQVKQPGMGLALFLLLFC